MRSRRVFGKCLGMCEQEGLGGEMMIDGGVGFVRSFGSFCLLLES